MDNKWNDRFLELATLVSSWSKDPSTCVGAVIVNDDRRVISMGYNGLPCGLPDIPEILDNRPLKYGLTAHAELNAILSAGRLGIPLIGTSIYCTLFPCSSCAKAIVQSGISSVYSPTPNLQDERWGKEFKLSMYLFQQSKVHLIFNKSVLDFSLPPNEITLDDLK